MEHSSVRKAPACSYQRKLVVSTYNHSQGTVFDSHTRAGLQNSGADVDLTTRTGQKGFGLWAFNSFFRTCHCPHFDM